MNPPAAFALPRALLLSAAILGGCVQTNAFLKPDVADAPEIFRTEAEAVAVRVTPPPTAETLEQTPLFQLLAAEFAGKREQPEDAVRRYAALARNTRDPAIAERAARIAMYANRNEEAFTAAQRWVELQPKNLDARQILAALLVRKGEPDGALEHLRFVLANDKSHDASRLRAIATLLSEEADRRTALAVMEKLIGMRAADNDAQMAYALLAIRAEDADKARKAMDTLLRRLDINPNLALAYVALLQKHGKQDEGLEFLTRALARAPNDFNLRLLYARLLTDARRFDEARREFEALESKEPENPDVLFALGLLSLQANQVDRAARHFESLLTHEERRDDAAFYLGQIEESRGNEESALKHYQSVVLGPNRYPARLREVVVLGRLKRLDEARTVLAAMEPASPDDARQRVLVEVELLSAAGRAEEAMQVFDKAIAEGYDATLLYNRAMLAERLGRLDQLEADLRQVLAHEPDNAQALNALGFTLADRTNRFEEARALIERALVASPNDFYILDSMGWVLFKLGKPAEALPYLEKALVLHDDPEVAAHLGEVLWALGRHDAALARWDASLKAHPEHPKLLETRKRLVP